VDAAIYNACKSELISIVGVQYVLSSVDELAIYLTEETGTYTGKASLVVFPQNKEQVSAIMRYCNQHSISVTPRGAGTSLAGNAISLNDGIIMILSSMDKILEIDIENHLITVQPGCIVDSLKNYVDSHGLYYPVDPASSGTSMIGGHVMTNAAGPRSYKYGSTKNYVRALELVLSDGTIIQTGTLTEKNSTGYNLTQLIVGSEGSLAIVTSITLGLVKKPPYNNTVLMSFESLEDALNTILLLRNSSVDISAIEFIEREALDLVARYEGQAAIVIEENCAAHLLIELESSSAAAMDQQLSMLAEIMESATYLNIIVADGSEQKELLWRMRKLIGHAVRHYSVYREVDTVVPANKMVSLIQHVKSIGKKYGFKSICYGHAGNGNIHVNILKDNIDEAQWHNILKNAVGEIFDEVIRLGGSLSGEHGIGILNKEFMSKQFTEVELGLMRGIKKVFDPKSIMNPGKIFPEY